MTDDWVIEWEMILAARRILSGEYQVPQGRATRAAALLARSALEHAVVRRVSELSGAQVDTTNMRHLLICLKYLPGGDPETEAAWAFSELSRACHEHAYELAPTHREVDHLIGRVASCVRSLRPAQRG